MNLKTKLVAMILLSQLWPVIAIGQDSVATEPKGADLLHAEEALVEEAIAEEALVEEIVITAPGARKELSVRSGWRPKSPEEAHQHIKNAYALLVELEQLAQKCNPDAIITYGDQLRLKPCENFIEVHDSRALVNYNMQCNGLVEWYKSITDELQSSPDWESSDVETLKGYAFFKQNIILACDLKTVDKNFKYLRTARRDIEKVRNYVASRGNAPAGFGGFAPITSGRSTENDDN